MKIVIKMLSTAEMRRRHKVAENGPVQAAIDSECMRYMSDYMPRRQAGELKHLMVAATTIGSGQINSGICQTKVEDSSVYNFTAVKDGNNLKIATAGSTFSGKKWVTMIIFGTA